MPTVSVRSNRVEAYGVITTQYVEAWTPDQLAQAADRIEKELRYMPVVSDKLYRENAGRESLVVDVVGMDWDAAIDILRANPRKFVDWSSEEFVAESENGTINPGLQTVLKRFQREGFLRGIIVGSNIDTENDILSVTARPNVTKAPKWAQALMERGDKFGSLLPVEEAEAQIKALENGETA